MPQQKRARPSQKRARQRAGRATRMAQLQQAQKRRSRTRRGVIIAIVIALAIGLAIYTGTRGGSSKKTTTSVTSTTLALGTGPGLVPHAAPPISASCNTPASGAVGTGATPATGHAVSIVPAPAHVPFPKLDGSSPRYTKFSAAPQFCIDVTKTYTATVTTDIGTMTMTLLPKDAPLTVNSFVFLASYHYYDGVVFQRVVTGFMDQGGDPTGTGSGGPGYEYKDELPSSTSAYVTGAVAMANSGANTNGSQFFIVVPGGGAELGSAAYTVFAQVTSGIAVAEKINSQGSASTAGTPVTYHKIIKVSITES